MQFGFTSLLPIAVLAATATAAPSEIVARNGGSSQCNTGSISCCQTTYQSNSQQATTLLGLLGIILGDIVGLVGVGCSSDGVVSLGGSVNCNQEPVCCSNNEFGGLIVIGCSPININL